MLSKKEIKDIQSLRHKKERDEQGMFMAEGPKIVKELLEILPSNIEKIYALKNWADQVPASFAPSLEIISEIELEKISALQTPNQVVALFNQPAQKEPLLSENSFCLYLDAIQDPGNLGTIIRIADWFNIKNIICTEGCADAYNAKVIQSSMGSIGRVSIYYDKEMNWLKGQPLPKYAATLNGKSVYSISKIGGGILLVGNESKGLQPQLLQMATEEITIPRMGGAESLNAAVATGIILSHLLN